MEAEEDEEMGISNPELTLAQYRTIALIDSGELSRCRICAQ